MPRSASAPFSRRAWLSLAVAGVFAARGRPAAAVPESVRIQEFADDGKPLGDKMLPKLTLSEAAWRKRLSPEAFEITRQAGTEPPYTGATWNEHAAGLYRCVDCGTALFLSDSKFDSGTGWPSFWQPIAKDNVVEDTDRSFGITRTAVSCRLCDAHLGHVFDDGPKPTGLRYCMNSAAMRFVRFS
jgi:peptide-methionine (R)-S-oxide reductase